MWWGEDAWDDVGWERGGSRRFGARNCEGRKREVMRVGMSYERGGPDVGWGGVGVAGCVSC